MRHLTFVPSVTLVPVRVIAGGTDPLDWPMH